MKGPHHGSELGHIVLILVDKLREADLDTRRAERRTEQEAERREKEAKNGICYSCSVNGSAKEVSDAELLLAREEGRREGSAQAANEHSKARIWAENRAARAEYVARSAIGALTGRQRTKLWPIPTPEDLSLSGAMGYTTIGAIADELLQIGAEG